MKITFSPSPIKKNSLCKQCKFDEKNNKCGERLCYSCAMYHGGGDCKCTKIKTGQPCPFFILSKKGKKNNE